MDINEIALAIEELENDRALTLVREAVESGLDPVEILEGGVIAGLKAIGARFESQYYFLAELMLGGRLADACMSVLDPYLPKETGPRRGVVVIGAVQGDLHDIGYGLVARQLQLAGYEVHSMGVNVPSMSFIDKAQQVKADIIGLSAFLVTTIPYCGEVIDYLRDMGLRETYKVIIGGAEASQALVNTIGADGWAPNAIEAVRLCDRLLVQEITASVGGAG